MHPSRRRKKRPNYGLRTVEVMRGPNGFGFTISGQQPCILSCIVTGSPADQAGLRAGDFLISVNGVSVSKVTHDAVVNLIGNCVGPIKMTIAENYYSDSSDEELDCGRVMNSRKPKYMHKPRPRTHKGDLRRTAVETNEKNMCKSIQTKMNEKVAENELNISDPLPMEDEAGPIEYRALVGYLGTIEMPNQLLPHNRLQTVCTCIRKLRQEKRLPTAVLMTILPTCLTLKNASNHILAIYPTNRVTYVGTTADRESRYFGLVTSATCDLRNTVNFEKKSNTGENCVEISNSCHVFVTDPKIVDHNIHKKKADIFRITCTTNHVTGNCLEFPHSALYIVSLIQNMYKLQNNDKNNGHISPVIANSPQPSASSNSDSGIGFRDDCGNISDRILVVEFPTHRPLPVLNNNNRPAGINVSSVNLEDLDVPLAKDHPKCLLNNVRSQKQDNKAADLNNIRACEGVKIKNQLDNFDKTDYLLKYNNNGNLFRTTCKAVSIKKSARAVSPSSLASSDDNTKITDTHFSQKYSEAGAEDFTHLTPTKKSVENISLHSTTDGEFKGSTDNLSVNSSKSLEFSNLFNVFKVPFDKKIKRQLKNANSCDNLDKYNENLSNYKLSPKTYGLSKPNYSCEELNTEPVDTKAFGSLQDLFSWDGKVEKRRNIIAQSEPDIRSSTPRSSSSCSNLCDQNGVAKCTSAEGPSAWSCSFEKLLEDPLGLHTFAEFLKKEFSAENIYFWCACERYRRIPVDRSGDATETTPTGGGAASTTAPIGTTDCERLQEAQRIYSQHLAQGAQEAVNVDAHGRQCAEQGLQHPDNTIFDQAQKQIFNLMKFDSYPRYLKSDIYRRCVSGEVDRAPLDARLQLQPPAPPPTPPSKLKKSVSNAEDRRRKSLLPWHRKNRSKSKDRGEIEYAQKQESTGVENEIRRNGRSEIHSSGSSLTSLDLAISNQDTSKTGQNNREDSSTNGRSALCKVNLSNGSTTVVQIRESETIQELVNRLLEKRGLNYSSYEVFTDKHGKPQDVTLPSSTLSGREVLVERRVTLKLDLPNRKTVTVKSRGCKQLSEVLRSTLHKYQYQLDRVTVVDADGRPLDLRLAVSEVDGMRVGIRIKDDVKQDNSIPVLKVNNVKVNKLEEITNKVFEGILQEKADSAIFKYSKSDRGSVKSEDWGSEHSSTFIGKFLRRDSGVHDRKKKLVSKCKGNINEEVSGDQNQSKKPLIAKLKAGANKLHVTCNESDELVEGLTRAQRRLEDQRGTEINFELPDFLKDKENNSISQTTVAIPTNKPLPNNTRFYSTNYSKSEEVSNYENRNILVQNSVPEADSSAESSSCQENVPSACHGLDSTLCNSAQQPSKTVAPKHNDPPPLPPKPKIVPIRPPNWGHLNGFYKPKDGLPATPIVAVSTADHRSQAMFLEHSSSSFV